MMGRQRARDQIVAIEEASNPSPWSHLAFEQEFARSVSTVVVALNDAPTVVGFVVYWLVGDEAHILNIAVAPEARGQGVGGRMLDHALDETRAAGAGFLMLEVREANSRARSLYHRRGFREVSRRTGYYRDNGETAVVLGCLLDDTTDA